VGATGSSSGASGGRGQIGLLLGGLLAFADAAEHRGEVVGGEFPVERPGGLVVAVHVGNSRRSGSDRHRPA
jgi:hypothetical protein